MDLKIEGATTEILSPFTSSLSSPRLAQPMLIQKLKNFISCQLAQSLKTNNYHHTHLQDFKYLPCLQKQIAYLLGTTVVLKSWFPLRWRSKWCIRLYSSSFLPGTERSSAGHYELPHTSVIPHTWKDSEDLQSIIAIYHGPALNSKHPC